MKKTVEDAYTLSRSSLVRADKPIPQYSNKKKMSIELENIAEISSST